MPCELLIIKCRITHNAKKIYRSLRMNLSCCEGVVLLIIKRCTTHNTCFPDAVKIDGLVKHCAQLVYLGPIQCRLNPLGSLIGAAIRNCYITHSILIIFWPIWANQGAGAASKRSGTISRKRIIENVHFTQVTHNNYYE